MEFNWKKGQNELTVRRRIHNSQVSIADRYKVAGKRVWSFPGRYDLEGAQELTENKERGLSQEGRYLWFQSKAKQGPAKDRNRTPWDRKGEG